jgi:hypothetical protein
VCDCCDTHLDATLSQRSIQSHTPCHQSDVWVHPPQNKRGSTSWDSCDEALDM